MNKTHFYKATGVKGQISRSKFNEIKVRMQLCINNFSQECPVVTNLVRSV